MGCCLKEVQLFCDDRTPKLNFICDLLDDNSAVVFRNQLPNESEKNISIIINIEHSDGSDCVVHERSNNIINIETPIVPYGIRIKTNYFSILTEDKIIKKNDMILILIPYPYAESSYLEKIAGLIYDNRFYQIKTTAVVYKNLNQNQAYTDIENSDRKNILENTKIQFKKTVEGLYEDEYQLILKLVNFFGFDAENSIKDLIDILAVKTNCLSTIPTITNFAFEKWKGDKKFFQEEESLFISEKLNDFLPSKNKSLFAEITSFHNNSGQTDVIKHFFEQYQKKGLSNIIECATNIYKYLIQDICFWNLDEDIVNFKKDLYELYVQVSKNHEVICAPTKDYKYRIKILNNQKCDIKFSNEIRTFIEEKVKNFIFEKLNEKEAILERIFV